MAAVFAPFLSTRLWVPLAPSPVQYRSSGIGYLVSSIQHPTSSICHLASSIQHLASSIQQHPTSSICYLVSGIGHRASGIWYPVSGSYRFRTASNVPSITSPSGRVLLNVPTILSTPTFSADRSMTTFPLICCIRMVILSSSRISEPLKIPR